MSGISVVHIATVDSALEGLLLNQLRALHQAGYQVTGISTPGPAVAVLEAAGIRHIGVPIRREPSPWADLLALQRLYRVLRRERFSIVHTHNPKPGLLGQLAAHLAGVPIIVNTIHGYYFHAQTSPMARRFYIALERLAAHCSDAILSQNKEDIGTAIHEGICKPAKISYLGNGIDLSRFDPAQYPPGAVEARRQELGLAPAAPVIGFVGRLAGRRKGLLDLLAAAQQLCRRFPDLRLLLVGAPDDGKADAVTPAIAERFDLAGHCLFLGELPNAELPLIYRLMTVLVLPSLFEGLPRAVMEAAAMGVPVVASDVRGNREAVRHEVNGLLTPLGDVAALADAIARLLSDQALARHLGQNGRQIALDRFDERQVFARVLAEYSRLLRARGLVAGPALPSHAGR